MMGISSSFSTTVSLFIYHSLLREFIESHYFGEFAQLSNCFICFCRCNKLRLTAMGDDKGLLQHIINEQIEKIMRLQANIFVPFKIKN